MIFPIRFQQQAPRNSWSIPSIPGPMGSPNPQVKPEERVETSWESAPPVHGSTAWKPNCRDPMDRYGSLAPATPECWIRQTFPDGESKGNHPQTTIRNVKHIRYIHIYIIHTVFFGEWRDNLAMAQVTAVWTQEWLVILSNHWFWLASLSHSPWRKQVSSCVRSTSKFPEVIRVMVGNGSWMMCVHIYI